MTKKVYYTNAHLPKIMKLKNADDNKMEKHKDFYATRFDF